VVEGRLIVGIVPVYQRREEFDYFPLYEEKSHAYCAVGHPLFEARDINADVLRQHEVVNHRYAIHSDKANFVSYDSQSASASQVEAVAILILTGRFLGFLPEHYAAPLVREGRLRVLCPEQIHLSTPFNLILRHNAPRSPLVKAFATSLGVDLKAPI
jgi:DNA-binding transcriptional LysR family regulator